MYKVFTVFLIFIATSTIAQENSFKWTDTSFVTDSKRIVHFSFAFDGPCTVKPCYYDCGAKEDSISQFSECDNKYIYDTIINFLQRNPNVKIEIRFYTDQRGSNGFNLTRTKKWAEGCLSELKQLNADMSRIAAIGLGESNPIIPEEEIRKVIDKIEKNELYLKNFRTEIIIKYNP